jgi:lytic murein transglycosylase
MRLRAVIAALALVAAPAALSTPAAAQSGQLSFDAYLQLLAAKARAAGVSERTIQAMTAGLTPNDRVIALDRSQPAGPPGSGFPPLAPYLRSHIDAARINQGRQIYQAAAAQAGQLQRTYGVPANVLISIWGHETFYGRVTGDFDLARSLASLAWEGRRRDLFETEFVDLLKMADTGIARSQLQGSYAGAFGNPQFLPSVYLRLAVDADGDGRKDIWNDQADTLASIANYFRDAGWRAGQPWGVRASVPAGFDVGAYRGKLIAPACPRVHERFSVWKTVAQWRQLGVSPQAPIAESALTSLFQPDGPGTPAWLLTGNYRVILEYNCSNYYAMSVGLLADEIAQ